MAVFFHEDEVVIEVTEDGVRENLLEGFQIGDQVGNPVYWVVSEHAAAAALLGLAPVLWILAARLINWRSQAGSQRAAAIVDEYSALPLPRRWAFWLVATSALVHGVLVFTHEPSAYTVAYAAGALLLAAAARWLLAARRGRVVVLALVGSVVAFWFLGVPPDQVGLATKLGEILALALLAAAPAGDRPRRFAAGGVLSLLVLTGVAAWVGAFAAVGPEGGHHGGEYPDPGTLVPYLERLEPTEEEHVAADDLYAEISVALAKFEDPHVAEAYGYDVFPIRGTSHHADNPEYKEDGRIFDPERPETLVYAEGASGPVLLGAMFQMPGTEPGPRVGGPLTVWHSHENICISAFPIALVGLRSPFGSCPIGAFNMPRTNEMIHAWTLDGVDDEWGHIDEEWLEQKLARS